MCDIFGINCIHSNPTNLISRTKAVLWFWFVGQVNSRCFIYVNVTYFLHSVAHSDVVRTQSDKWHLVLHTSDDRARSQIYVRNAPQEVWSLILFLWDCFEGWDASAFHQTVYHFKPSRQRSDSHNFSDRWAPEKSHSQEVLLYYDNSNGERSCHCSRLGITWYKAVFN